MSRKFGKFLLFSAVAGAAACGTYYFLKSREGAPAPAEPDTDDDFDDFGEDLDDEDSVTRERSYVSLNLDKAEAFASEAFHKAREVIADSVQQVKDTVKSVTEGQSRDTAFTDLTAVHREKESEEIQEEDASEDDTCTGPAPSVPQASDDMTEITTDAIAADAAVSAATPEDGAAPEADQTLPSSTAPAAGTVEEFFDDDKN